MRGKSLECPNVGNPLFFQGDVAAADPMLMTHRGHAGLNGKVCLTLGSSFQKSESSDGGGLRMFVPGYNQIDSGNRTDSAKGKGSRIPSFPSPPRPQTSFGHEDPTMALTSA